MKISAAWKNLIENASLNSILGGGMSVPQISLHKFEEHIEVSIRVPGLDSQDLFVEIQGEKVVVFRILELADKDGNGAVKTGGVLVEPTVPEFETNNGRDSVTQEKEKEVSC